VMIRFHKATYLRNTIRILLTVRIVRIGRTIRADNRVLIKETAKNHI